MKNRRSWYDKFMRTRSNYRRAMRMLFMSPAEARFVQLMGGKMWTFGHVKSMHTGFPLTFVLSRGRVLRQHRIRREVRCGKYYVDFANDVGWAIEIDGSPYHQDVVEEFDREAYMYDRGWRLLRIKAPRLWNDPDRVKKDVLAYLTK